MLIPNLCMALPSRERTAHGAELIRLQTGLVESGTVLIVR